MGRGWRAGRLCADSHKPVVARRAASVREVLNIVQAEQSGCHIVTVQHDILAKAAKLLSMDLAALSLDPVKMFANDAASAGYQL